MTAPLLGRMLINSPVDCFSEGASRRVGMEGCLVFWDETGWSTLELQNTLLEFDNLNTGILDL